VQAKCRGKRPEGGLETIHDSMSRQGGWRYGAGWSWAKAAERHDFISSDSAAFEAP
jgi:hypothetical protein